MSKFLKGCLVVGGICIVAGIAASGAGIFNGGLPKLKEEILNGEWTIGGEMTPFFELEEQNYFKEDEIITVGMDNTQDSFKISDIDELTVKSAGVTVKFAEYDGDEILVEASKVYQYQAYVEDRELYIIARGQNTKDLGEGVVNITVPESVFDAADKDFTVKAAVSVVEFDRLAAKEVELEVSAGTILWNELTAQDFSARLAAGTINGGNVNVSGESEIIVSAGSLSIAGIFGTKTDVEMSAGMVEIALADAYTNYNYDISCAGGSVTVGDEVTEGVAGSREIMNNAVKNIDVECSMGAVNISFAD